MNKQFFRLRHKPTGLFYKPSNGAVGKCNLSKGGKAYNKNPTLAHLGNFIYGVPKKIPGSFLGEKVKIPVVSSDWEICVYQTILKEIIQCGDDD